MSSVRWRPLFWLPASSPSSGTSFSHGMPELCVLALSLISPARPTVCPSSTTTRLLTLRSENVGELRPAVVVPGTTPLTSCEMSSVTSPPLFTRGVTSRITPVSR